MGRPISSVQLKSQLNAQITAGRGEFGLVSEYEEREAAIFVLCPWHIWTELEWQERAAAIAHYRVHFLVEAHVNEAAEKAANKS